MVAGFLSVSFMNFVLSLFFCLTLVYDFFPSLFFLLFFLNDTRDPSTPNNVPFMVEFVNLNWRPRATTLPRSKRFPHREISWFFLRPDLLDHGGRGGGQSDFRTPRFFVDLWPAVLTTSEIINTNIAVEEIILSLSFFISSLFICLDFSILNSIKKKYLISNRRFIPSFILIDLWAKHFSETNEFYIDSFFLICWSVWKR